MCARCAEFFFGHIRAKNGHAPWLSRPSEDTRRRTHVPYENEEDAATAHGVSSPLVVPAEVARSASTVVTDRARPAVVLLRFDDVPRHCGCILCVCESGREPGQGVRVKEIMKQCSAPQNFPMVRKADTPAAVCAWLSPPPWHSPGLSGVSEMVWAF